MSKIKPPKGWDAPWRAHEGGHNEDAIIAVDDDEYRATNGAVRTEVAVISQGEHSFALAKYIVRLHNARDV